MALGQGTILTADQMRDALRKSNTTYRGTNTWSDAYASIEAQKQNALGQLGNQYSEELLDAYVASQRQASAIQASNLFQGYKDLALDENRALLDQAFEQSRNTLLQKSAQVEQASAEQMDSIDYALNTQATNQAKLYQYALEYLPYLYSKDSTLFDNDINLGRFLVNDGQGGSRLMTTEEITSKMFTKNAEGELELNNFGTDFLNMIEGYDITSKGYSFGDFLAEKDSDLFNWSMSIDPYNYGKTNAGTYRQLTGDRKEGAWSPKRDSVTGMPITTPTGEDFAENPIGIEMNEKYDSLMTSFNDKPPKNWDDAAAFMNQIGVLQDELEKYADGGYANEIKAMRDQWKYLYDVLNGTNETGRNTDPTKVHSNKSLAHIISSALQNYQNTYNTITRQGKAKTDVTDAPEVVARRERNEQASQMVDDVVSSGQNIDSKRGFYSFVEEIKRLLKFSQNL